MTTTLSDLPLEVLTLAIDYTHPRTPFELNRFGAVNRTFRAASSNCTSWRRLAPQSPSARTQTPQAHLQRPHHLADGFRDRYAQSSVQARKGLCRLWKNEADLPELTALVQRFPDNWDIVHRAVTSEPKAAQHFYTHVLAHNPWSQARYERRTGNAFRDACPEFRADPYLTHMAIALEPAALAFSSDTLRLNRHFVHRASRLTELRRFDVQIGPFWRRNPRDALEVVRIDPRALLYLDNTLKLHEDFILQAIVQVPGRIVAGRDGNILDHQTPAAFEFVDSSLRSNAAFMLEAAMHYECTGFFLDDTLKKDRHFVRTWVQRGIPNLILSYADPKFRKDRSFVRELALINYSVFREADVSLHQDKNLIQELVRVQPQAFRYVHQHYQTDTEFLSSLMQYNPRILRYAGNAINLDKAFVGTLAKNNPSILHYAHYSLKNDHHFMLQQGQTNFRAFVYASPSLRSNAHFMLKAIQSDPRAYILAQPVLKRQKDFLVLAGLLSPSIHHLHCFQTALQKHNMG